MAYFEKGKKHQFDGGVAPKITIIYPSSTSILYYVVGSYKSPKAHGLHTDHGTYRTTNY